jgi:hypothetical protein
MWSACDVGISGDAQGLSIPQFVTPAQAGAEAYESSTCNKPSPGMTDRSCAAEHQT